jgi:hypothetical protein
MLKPPYEILHETGNTQYSYLSFSDLPYTFLGMTAFETILEQRPRLLRKPKNITRQLIIGHKLLPLNSMVLYLLMYADSLQPNTYELDVNDEKINIYGEWDDFDVEDLKKGFYNQVLSVSGVSNYTFPVTIHNKTARGFDKDGYKFFALEKNGTFSRTYWLIRTTKYGAINFVSVQETGTETDSIATSTTIYMLDRKLISRVIDDFKNRHFEKKVEEINVEEIKDAIENSEKLN